MEPQKQTKLDGNDTTILLQHYILCHFANYAHQKTLYMHYGLFTPTKSMDNYTPTRHSALNAHSRAFCTHMINSNKSLQPNTLH